MTRAGFQAAVEEIFGVPRGLLKDEDSRDSIEGWTSVADVQLFTLITSEMGIEPDDELLEAVRIGDLMKILGVRGAFTG
jgi:hypothetical protein